MVAWWIGLRLPTSPLFQGFLKLVRDGISKEASQELIRCFASIRIRLPANVWSVDSPHHHRIWPSSQVFYLRLQALPIFSPAGWPVIYSKNNLVSVIFVLSLAEYSEDPIHFCPWPPTTVFMLSSPLLIYWNTVHSVSLLLWSSIISI